MPTFSEVLQTASAIGRGSGVNARLVVHQADSIVYYGYGELAYSDDLTNIINSTFPLIGTSGHSSLSAQRQPQPTRGLSSVGYRFKFLSNQEYNPAIGTPPEYQIFPIGIEHLLDITIYEKNNLPTHPPQTIVNIGSPSGEFQSISFSAQTDHEILIGFSTGLYDSSQNTIYSFSFGTVGGIIS